MIERWSGFGTASGTYNVRASEQARHKLRQKTQPKQSRSRLKLLKCVVQFLDDSQHKFEIEKSAKGIDLLTAVFDHLDLIERDYFGLQYSEDAESTNGNGSPSENSKWLDPRKPVKKQIRRNDGHLFYFRVKFFVVDPSKLKEEFTRYHFFLQVKRDLTEGNLPASPSAACLLASYVLQSTFGDYCQDDNGNLYSADFRFFPSQTEEMLSSAIQLYKIHRGQTPAQAEFNFLDHAKRLEMYGLDLHKAKDSAGRDIQIGVSSIGVAVFQDLKRVNTFSWGKIVKISFKRKQFFLQLRREASEDYDTLLGFNVVTYRSCKNLWKSCVEHHAFFRLSTPLFSIPRRFLGFGGSLGFGIGSRFRFTGRTEYETVENGTRQARERERGGFRNGAPSRQTMPTGSHVAEEIRRKFPALFSPSLRASGRSSNGNLLKSHEAIGSGRVQSSGIREPKQAWSERTPSDDEGGFLPSRDPMTVAIGLPTPLVTPTPQGRPFTPALAIRGLTYADEEGEGEDPPAYATDPSQAGSVCSDEGIVLIRLRPDENGRFGFNVKGGVDQGQPVLVSRVVPNAPADRCFPRLNEGDQLVQINGRDVNPLTHDQVVVLIRNVRESNTSDLFLKVKQNAYTVEEIEEPSFEYVPDPSLALSISPPHSYNGPPSLIPQSLLEQAIAVLEDGMSNGSILAQFEILYRRKPGLAMTECKKPENLRKNRYGDINPYDSTRVALQTCSSGDYINADHVQMEIPGSGIVNRYIATQGPLPHTLVDFWSMVWEAQSTLIVMLTTLLERGRVKCHKYWPDLDTSMEFADLQVSCLSEVENESFAFRELKLINRQTGLERHITQMQYLAWPDHGVPESHDEFVEFVNRVRTARIGMVEPTVVHCSAGIGRTGVLILMETAMGSIEANEPVYPLEIVKIMRDQRAMMVQTPSQFSFVCKCILQVYNQGLVRPLPEFRR